MLRETHESIVDDWMANAQAHDDDNYQFLRSLKWRPSSKKVDRAARRLHEQVFQVVDCTRCANCCRTLRPDLTDDDIDRIALHLGQPREKFINTFLIWDEADRCYRTKTTPCPLLCADGRCTVYDVRAPTDPDVLALEHPVPQPTDSPSTNGPHGYSAKFRVHAREPRCVQHVSLNQVCRPALRFPPQGPPGRVPLLRRYYQSAATSCRPSRLASLPSLGSTSAFTRSFRSSTDECAAEAWSW